MNGAVINEILIKFKLFYRICILFVSLFLNPFTVPFLKAQISVSDYSVPKLIYFPIDRAELLSEYSDNASMFDSMDRLLCDPDIYSRIASICIVSAASPISNREYNSRLSFERGVALRDYILRHYPYLGENTPYVYSMGIDWEGFRAIVESDFALPSRSAILSLLENEPDENSILSALRTIGGYSTYRYLLDKIYPQLQYATLRIRLDDGSYIPPNGGSLLKAYIEKTACDTIFTVVSDTVLLPCPDCPPCSDCPPLESKTDPDSLLKKNYYFGLKTNLLYDAALLPNLSAEFPFGKDRKWSLVLEGNWSWWTFGNPVRSYHRIQAAGLELRRWFASSAPLLGHAVGVYALGGTYDLRLWPKSDDSRGWLSNWSYSYGLSYAWSLPVARRFHLELGLAAGYMGGQYYDYKFHINDDHQRWEWTTIRNRNYWGLTRAEISLVWLIGRNNNQLKKGVLQ